MTCALRRRWHRGHTNCSTTAQAGTRWPCTFAPRG